ncbi:hypothetical protein VTK56DRAFT_7290 [Thermocarpiscus australiensis]
MKVPAVLLSLALAGTAAAQSPQLPPCAQGCANKFLSGGIGNCGTDPACICGDKSFIGDIACCLAGVCDPPQQSSAVAYAASLCSAFGVTTLPSTVSCSTSAPAATTTSGGASGSAVTTTSGGASGSAAATGPTTSAETTPTSTVAPAANTATTTTSGNYGPRQTAAAGLGAIGGIMAAVALL